MSIEITLHPEDETMMVVTGAEEKNGTYRVVPNEAGNAFQVTLPDGTTTGVSCTDLIWGKLWYCGTSQRGRIRKHHDGQQEVTGDVRPIRVVMAWQQVRRNLWSTGKLSYYGDIARRVASETARIERMQPVAPNAAAAFCAKYGGQRINRR